MISKDHLLFTRTHFPVSLKLVPSYLHIVNTSEKVLSYLKLAIPSRILVKVSYPPRLSQYIMGKRGRK